MRPVIRALKYDWFLDKMTRNYTCKVCGWSRDYSENPLWAMEPTVDVVTGDKLTRIELVKRDVERHSCRSYEATVDHWGSFAQKNARHYGTPLTHPVTGKPIK